MSEVGAMRRLRQLVADRLTPALRRLTAPRHPTVAQRFEPSTPVSPRVTVVVTACDRPRLLALALRSVQLQRHRDLECVVVDDASLGDEVARVVRDFGARDHRFRLVRHHVRSGLAAARNTGIMHAEGQLVCFLDDDDYLCSDSIASRLAAVPPATEVVGSYCDWVPVGADDELDAFRPLRRAARRPLVVDLVGAPWGVPFIATAPLVRRDVLIEVGGFNEALDRAEDAELWMRLLRAGYVFHYSKSIGVAYRQSAATMVSSAPEAQLDRLLEIGDWLDRPLEGHELAPGPLPEPAPLSLVKARAEQLPQLLRYLCLIAERDPDQAVVLGRTLLPVTLRSPASLEPHRAAVEATLRRRAGVEAARAAGIVGTLLTSLNQPSPTGATSAVPSSAGVVDAPIERLRRGIGETIGRMPATRRATAWSELGPVSIAEGPH